MQGSDDDTTLAHRSGGSIGALKDYVTALLNSTGDESQIKAFEVTIRNISERFQTGI